MGKFGRSSAILFTFLLILVVSCTARSRVDSVIKGFFREINQSNFETAKANYLATSLINDLNAPAAFGHNRKAIQESFKPVAGSIDSVDISGETVNGEEATAQVTLNIAWGAKESGVVSLIKQAGTDWKIENWADFRTLGAEHQSNAANWCNARNLPNAVAEYQAAMQESPQDSMIVNNLGTCYQTLGRPDDAISQYKKAIGMHPKSVWDPYVNLGLVYSSRGDIDHAEEAYLNAISNKPDDAGALNGLAWMYATNGIKLDKAIDLAQRAVRLAPNDANIADTLGWAYYRRGSKTEALQYLAQALAKAPRNEVFRSHYDEAATSAEVHLARAQQMINAGSLEQASGECDAALRQEPNNQQAKDLKASIGKQAAIRLVTDARQLFEKQQYDPAISECDAALRYDPQNVDAQNLKAKIAEVKKVLGY